MGTVNHSVMGLTVTAGRGGCAPLNLLYPGLAGYINATNSRGDTIGSGIVKYKSIIYAWILRQQHRDRDATYPKAGVAYCSKDMTPSNAEKDRGYAQLWFWIGSYADYDKLGS